VQPAIYVVVTGLPASGKSALAEPLADALGIPWIAKDAIKEQLFESEGYGGWDRSKELSRAADAAMVVAARNVDAAVLDNFWHPESVAAMLAPLGGRRVEVCCRCPAETAYERFKRRQRHPGHADDENVTRLDDFIAYARFLPLGLGPVVDVDTERGVDIRMVTERVRAAGVLDASARPAHKDVAPARMRPWDAC
jgi:predicted kinase